MSEEVSRFRLSHLEDYGRGIRKHALRIPCH